MPEEPLEWKPIELSQTEKEWLDSMYQGLNNAPLIPHKTPLIQNYGRPSGLWMTKEYLTNEQRAELRKKLSENVDIVKMTLQELERTYFSRAQLIHDEIQKDKPDNIYLLALQLQIHLAMRDAVLEVAQKLGVEIEKTQG